MSKELVANRISDHPLTRRAFQISSKIDEMI